MFKSKLKTNHGTDQLCLSSFTYTVTEFIYWQPVNILVEKIHNQPH